MKTITLEIPESVTVTGARGITRDIDLTKLDSNTLAGIIDYWFGVVTVRASAGVEGFEAKTKAENDKADRLAVLDWTPGAGGGGGKLSVEVQAERRAIASLFVSRGYTQSKADKAAKQDNALEAFFLYAIAKQENRADVTAEEVQAAIDNNRAYIDGLVAAQVDAIKAEAARKKKAAEGLTF